MAMFDEIKEQQKKLKGKSPREKWNYFWYYYKIHTIAVIIALVLLGTFIKDSLSAKDYAFSATLLNSYGMDVQNDLEADFAAYANIDTNTYDCFIDTSSTLSYDTMSEVDLAVSQRIVAMAQTDGIDILVSNSEPFTTYAENSMFLDLREELSAEEYAKYEKDFYYIDQAVVDANSENTTYDENGNIQLEVSPDHSDPNSMKEPIPVGIYLRDSAKLKEWNCYLAYEEPPIFGFVFSSERKDACHLFLQYLAD